MAAAHPDIMDQEMGTGWLNTEEERSAFKDKIKGKLNGMGKNYPNLTRSAILELVITVHGEVKSNLTAADKRKLEEEEARAKKIAENAEREKAEAKAKKIAQEKINTGLQNLLNKLAKHVSKNVPGGEEANLKAKEEAKEEEVALARTNNGTNRSLENVLKNLRAMRTNNIISNKLENTNKLKQIKKNLGNRSDKLMTYFSGNGAERYNANFSNQQRDIIEEVLGEVPPAVMARRMP